jgi:hypothetical protein
MTPLPPQKTFSMRDFRRNPQRFWATAKAGSLNQVVESNREPMPPKKAN